MALSQARLSFVSWAAAWLVAVPAGSADVGSALSKRPFPSAILARPFLVGGGLSNGGGLAVVGDLLAEVRSFGGGGMAHFAVCFGVVSGRFGDEGFQGVVAA